MITKLPNLIESHFTQWKNKYIFFKLWFENKNVCKSTQQLKIIPILIDWTPDLI